MPYISFKTNHKLTLRQENTIKSKSGTLGIDVARNTRNPA